MANKDRPNVIFAFADEWRAQATGYSGDPNCRTPTLDAFAAESINFTHAVAGCPVCCPYRGSLLTGTYPLTHGIVINDMELPPDSMSIARAFSAGGYQTGYIGKWHVHGSPEGRYERRKAPVPRSHQMGFDYWKAYECCHDYNRSPWRFNDDPTPHLWEGYDAFAQSHDAARYCHDHAKDDQPFMLMLSWGPPHFPLDSAPHAYQAIYQDRELELRPNVPPALYDEAQAYLRGYYAHIAAMDDALKILLDGVRDAGIEGETIVIFAADHGEMAKSQGLNTKLFPFDESIRVPFLVRDPRRKQVAGSSIPVPIDGPDVMPTLLGLCGLAIPETVEGTDHSPLILGHAEPTGDEAALLIIAAEFTEIRVNDMRAYRGLRTGRYTYVRDTWGPWLLFDNEADPYQMRNLIGRPEAATLQAELESRLQARLMAMNDPFDDGPTVLEQRGLTHYREVRGPIRRTWRYPWDQLEGARPERIDPPLPWT